MEINIETFSFQWCQLLKIPFNGDAKKFEPIPKGPMPQSDTKADEMQQKLQDKDQQEADGSPDQAETVVEEKASQEDESK